MIEKLHPFFLLRSLANRIISKEKISDLIYRLFGSGLLVYLLFLSVEKGKWAKNKNSVLCIRRDLFNKDIVELRKRTRNLNWLVIGTSQLAYVQSAWTPKEMRYQTLFQKYCTEDYQDIWKKNKIFALRFLKLVVNQLNVKAILSANIDYWQDEGIRRACRDLNIPFLVLDKECCTIPKVSYRLTKYYREANYKFHGNGIAVFNKNMKNVLIKSGVFRSEDIYITGAPRIDAWRDVKLDKYNQDTIVLLPYGIDYGLKTDKNFKDVLDIFLSIARRYSSIINFVIKCKNNRYKQNLEKKITKDDSKHINLTVDMPLYDLFPRSRLVIGYNTLALIEALISKAVIAIPQWEETGRDYGFQQFNPKSKTCSRVIKFVKSKSDMKKLLERIINNPYSDIDMEERINLLKKYFYYNQDKTNSEHVEDFVSSYFN